jgi:polyisoprenyl-teichoic acid--peptidoglycan teichoic acid transferase
MATNTSSDKSSGKVIVARKSRPGRRFRWWLLLIPLGFLLGTALGAGEKLAEQMGFGVGDIYHRVTGTETHFGGRKQVNILLIGADNSNTGNGLGDSLMLARIDTERQRMGVVSLPRDTRARIPGHGIQKVNAAHALGGNKLQVQTVANLLGVPIDYYIQLNSMGLAKLVNAMGGVEIDVEKRMKYSDPSQNLFIDLNPGLQVLDGTKAVGYVRFRHDAVGDYGRIGRQQKFIRALAKKMTGPGTIVRLPRIIAPIQDAIRTNMTMADLFYMARVAKQVDPQNVPMAMLPTEPVMIRHVSCLQLQPKASERLLAEVLYAQPCDVELVDATGAQNATSSSAINMVGTLQQAGFRVVESRTAAQRSTSRIIERFDRPEKAEKLQRLLPGAQLVRLPDPESNIAFTIEIGQDYLASSRNTPDAAGTGAVTTR